MQRNEINEFLILLKMRIDKLTLCLLLTLELRAELTGLDCESSDYYLITKFKSNYKFLVHFY